MLSSSFVIGFTCGWASWLCLWFSVLGVHSAASVQAPLCIIFPKRAVGLLVMLCSKIICLINTVKCPECHFFPLYFFILMFCHLVLMSAVVISHKEAFYDVATGLLMLATLRYVNTNEDEQPKDSALCTSQLCLYTFLACLQWSKPKLNSSVAFWPYGWSRLCLLSYFMLPAMCFLFMVWRSGCPFTKSPPVSPCSGFLQWHIIFG